MNLKSILVSYLFYLFLSSNIAAQSTPADFQGIWLGRLEIPDTEIRLAYRITVNKDLSISVIHDSPDYGFNNIPVSEVSLKKDSIRINVGLFGAEFKGKIQGDLISGSYRHKGPWIPIKLKRELTDPQGYLDYMVPRLNSSGEKELSYLYHKPEDLGDGWESDDIYNYEVNFKLIDSLLKNILSENYKNIHTLVIIKNGKLVLDEYFFGYDAQKLHPIHSNTKGLTCLLGGICLEQGLIKSMNEKLFAFFPEYGDSFTGSKKDITMEHVLSMSTGIEWDESSYSYYDQRNNVVQFGQHFDGIKYILDLPLKDPPGTKFNYNSGMMVVLADVIRRVSKVSFEEFALKSIFSPLKINDYRWEYYPGARIRADGGLHLRTRDLAKLASLYMNKGRWGKTQIIDSTWFNRSENLSGHCDLPEYWNHWGEGLFSVNGYPVRFFSGGGFGGQVIFGFPNQDLVVAINAGNYITGTNQHEMMEKFILPAFFKPEMKQYKIPINSSSIILENLQWNKSVISNLGCIKGCLDYLGKKYSMAWIFGASGYAFALNIHDNVLSKSLGVWNNQRTYQLCQNLGVNIEKLSRSKWDSNFEEYQHTAWQKITSALDEGIPCYGFNLNIPESYIIYGYDTNGYLYKGMDCHSGCGPKCWNRLGTSEIGWLELQIVRPGIESTKIKVIKDALQFAVDISNNPEQYAFQDFCAGLEAYDNWIRALKDNRHDPFGMAYNTAAWAESRSYAYQFLMEAQNFVSPELNSLFEEAINNYKKVSLELKKLSELFPYHDTLSWEMENNKGDSEKILEGINCLKSAREAEERGLLVLNKIVELM